MEGRWGKMPSPAVQNALDAVPAIRGVTQSYVDFTTKLVTDVMNALVASSISQMRAYADLVSQLERGLSAFKVQAASPAPLIAWIESRIPETGTNAAQLTVPTAALSATSATVIKNLYATKLVSVLGPAPGGPPHGYVVPGFTPAGMSGDPGAAAPLLVGAALPAAAVGDPTNCHEYSTTAPQPQGTDPLPAVDGNGNTPIDLASAVRTVLADDAASTYAQLDKLVSMGLLRIVITDGHILTKMTFEMRTSDASNRNSQDIYGSSVGVSASAGASWGWGSASLRASYNQFNVRIANEHSQTSTEIYTTMMGEVLVNYRSDFFPALPSQARP